tara:strand:+ start:1238 stop:4621 length:3384 start_codon:yes stop_codon:yes gene_type:complete
MSEKKFRFVSPGVFIEEIDKSRLPDELVGRGPLVAGRARKGPSMVSTRVDSFAEFVSVFGNPIPGGAGGDVWRLGNFTSPTYAAYAAQAYLRNNAPVNFVRLVGSKHTSATTDAGTPGWTVGDYNRHVGTSAEGAVTITVADVANLGDGDTITLISTDGTSIVCTLKGTGDTTTSESTSGNVQAKTLSAGNYANTTLHSTAQAVEIATAINYNTYFTATSAANVITIVQATAGSTGNTSITIVELGASALTKTDFSGGTSVHGGGAQGLFIFNSGTIENERPSIQSGTLAAVWYFNSYNASAYLVGTDGVGNSVTALGTMVKSPASSTSFNVEIRSGSASGSVLKTKTHFDFDPDSDKFIRKVFNTNPTMTNTDQVATTNTNFAYYWLGETFEGALKTGDNQQGPLSTSGDYFGIILPLKNNTDSVKGGNFKQDAVYAKSGWIFAQDFNDTSSYFNPASQLRLFRFCALGAGAWYQKNLKISITDIAESTNKYNKFGSFTVEVRDVRDTDNNKIVLEKFENLDLNPNSPNYIARVVGDQYALWNEARRRNIIIGTYENRSDYVRVELNTEVENGGVEPTSLPFGFEGPPQYINWFFASGSDGGSIYTYPADPGKADTSDLDKPNNKFVLTGEDNIESDPAGNVPFNGIAQRLSGACIWPRLKLRKSSAPTTDGTLSDPRDAYFGIDTRRTQGGRVFDDSYLDLVSYKPKDVGELDTGTYTSASFFFTLDDLSASSDHKPSDPILKAQYVSGSRDTGTSITALGVTVGDSNYAGSVKNLIRLGYNQFTVPLFGGFDGFDVTETEPLRNSKMTDGTSTRVNSFEYNTYERAIDIIKDREIVDANLAAVPGLTLPSLTTKLLTNCEERGDVLAIVDLESGYVPKYERTTGDLTEAGNLGSVDSTVNSLRDRNLNSSYGCAYYPWVLVRDSATTGQVLWVPPSVVALGVMGNSETASELWFAPAGFNRGGLTEGKSGLTVVGVRDRLTSKDRDDLYEQNVNPIASFPSEGVVVFGQKTLQTTRSALDRINVRRLLIFLKKEISFISSRILFDQNVSATWTRFLGQVDPLLASVQARFGLTDYKIILDETTTTPELVDRNILYAKIFLKPARAIEYIALDFIITATGASFEE